MPTVTELLKYVKDAPTLLNALNAIRNVCRPSEVAFFRTMLAYFDNKPFCEISEVHQHYVEYFNTVLNKVKRCEIADLMIVSFSNKRQALKLQFLQAKRNKYTDIRRQDKDPFRFSLDVPQYQLLLSCPLIDPKKTGLPSNILHDANCCSITSYGVFYGEQNSVNFAYEVTPMLTPNLLHEKKRTSTVQFGTNKTVFSKDIYSPCACHNICTNLLSTLNGNEFEKAICYFQIGALIEPHLAEKLAEMIKNQRHVGPSDVYQNFETFIENYQASGDGSNHDSSGNDGNDGDDPFTIEWIIPSYLMLVDIDNIPKQQ